MALIEIDALPFLIAWVDEFPWQTVSHVITRWFFVGCETSTNLLNVYNLQGHLVAQLRSNASWFSRVTSRRPS